MTGSQTYLRDNRKSFIEQIERLEKGLKGKYTPAQLDVLYNQVSHFKTSYLIGAVDHLLNMKMMLPPPHDVVVCCQNESYQDDKEEEKADKRFARKFFDGGSPVKSNMGREACKLIIDMLTVNEEGFFLKRKPLMTKDQLYQRMLEMEEKYPGVGWRFHAEGMMSDHRRRVRQFGTKLKLVNANV